MFIEKFIKNQEDFSIDSKNIYFIHSDPNLNYELSEDIVKKENVKIYTDKVKFIESLVINRSDKLYFHYLSELNQKLAIKYKKNTSYWLFWGGEIYGLPYFNYDFYLPITKKYIYSQKSFYNRVKEKIETRFGLRIRLLLKIGMPKVFKHINYFCHFLPQEYEIIKNQFTNLYPSLINWNYLSHCTTYDPSYTKTLTIIGQSATYSNNHLDILNLLKLELKNEKVLIPLSYPKNLPYTRKIESLIKSQDLKFELLQKSIPYAEYLNKLKSVKYAVFGFTRNQGVGNIVELLLLGAKVFLVSDNPFLKYLKSINIDVFTIEQFNDRENLKIDFEKNTRIIGSIFGKEAVKKKYIKILN